MLAGLFWLTPLGDAAPLPALAEDDPPAPGAVAGAACVTLDTAAANSTVPPLDLASTCIAPVILNSVPLEALAV